MSSTDGVDPRHGSARHRRPDHGAGRRRRPGADPQRARRAGRRRPADSGDRRALADPPCVAEVHRARAEDRDPRDRHQGHRPDRAVRQGRQDRPVRRRRRGQDGRHHGADPQRAEGPRRQVGLLRRRRAHPRGERPLPRDEGIGSAGHRCADLRPDERAARRAPAGGALRTHRRRVFPRRRGAGRAAVHRQHLPVHAGRRGSVGTAGADAERGGIPADAGDRDGRPAGADHLDPERLDHLGAGDLRARRRPHRPGAGDGVRPPRRHRGVVARPSPSWGSTPPSIRSIPTRGSWRRSSSASGTTTSPSACSARCSVTRRCRTSSPFSAWTNCPKKTS